MAEGSPVVLGRRGWLRRYPPLTLLVVAVLITAIYLPSALNLPQSNPSTVLEYAPVPPDDETPPSTEGSISALGLGSSGSLTTSATPPQQQQQTETAESERPTVKRCVGSPPRQTEDPNAPPCVAFFDGDNGGTTWQGVTGDEIVILHYVSTSITIGTEDGSQESPPAGSYCDVDGPPNEQEGCLERSKGLEDHFRVKATRALSRYFNERFQTYGRRIHFWIYWSSGSSSPTARRSQAADNWETLKPFAVIDSAFFGGHNAIYAESMVKRRSMVFGSFGATPASYFRTYAPMIWNWWPDIEHWADQYVSYVCQKVAPYRVSHSGNSGDNGKPRKYALLSTTDPNWEGNQYFADLAREGLKNCRNGAELDVVADLTYSRNQYAVDSHPDASSEARVNIAEMRSKGVTSVLWLSGFETEHSKAADNASYYPEWILAGDQLNDSINNAREQNQRAWRHAWVATNQLREDRPEDAPCRQAYRESDPQGNDDEEFQACIYYRNFFTLYKAIQVAGPYLTPSAIDQGQHAIPRQPSDNPFIAACFYDPGDFTCVKDMHEAWWDPSAPDPDGDPEVQGCWRMVNSGQRYLAWAWKGGDAVFANRRDPCNTVESNSFINPYGPAG